MSLPHPIRDWSVLALVFLALLGAARAQTPVPGTLEAASRPIPAGGLDRFFKHHKPLAFGTEVKTLGLFTRLGNTPLRPDKGDGPFPAVVLTPTCGGVGTDAFRNRLKDMLDAGYLVLAPESYEPRGQTDCRNGAVGAVAVVRDTLDALAHLHTLPQVDKTRIYQVGYSMGSLVAAAVAGPAVTSYFNSPHRFRASVGWYGSCGFQGGPNAPVAHYLRGETDRPVLLLMAEADRETPIQPFCFPLLEQLKAQGRPVEWHVYGDGVTHAWDADPGYTFTTGFGETIRTRYSAEATADATRRTLEFLNRH